MTTNLEVAEAWIRGEPKASGNMHTDGKSIYSYALRVGHIDPQGKIRIRNAWSPRNGNKGGKFYSMTTSSKHMSAVNYASAPWSDNREIIADADFDTEVQKHGG